MLKNYIKIALRTFGRHKAYTSINVIGLTLSLACGLMMLLWVQDEYSQDRYYEDSEQVYRLWRNFPDDTGLLQTKEATPYPVADALQKDFPEITDATAFRPFGAITLRDGNRELMVKGCMGHFSWFDIFSIPLVQGTIEGTDEKLDGIFISTSLAEQYFGEDWRDGVIGQTIDVDGRDVGETTLQVAGVFEDLPAFSRFDFQFMTNVRQFAKDHARWTSWGGSAFWTYFKVKAGTNREQLQAKITGLVGANGGQQSLSLYLQNVGDSYLYSQFENGKATSGRITYVRIFFFAALFLMLMACINFVNLATVQATRRAGEVGVRKVIGADKKALFTQFMAEAVLITLTAVIFAVFLCEAFLPYANDLLGKQMSLNFASSQIWLTLALITGVVSLLAGAYPSFVLSSFPITNILKNKLGGKFNSNAIRKGLVITQFVLSALVLTSSLIIQQQVNFIQHKDLGMDRNQIIQLNIPNQLIGKTHELKNALLNSPTIAAISQVQQSPIDIGRTTDDFYWPGKNPDLETRIQILHADKDLATAFKMDMVEGQFHQKIMIDSFSDQLVLNEKAANLMGLKDPVGKMVHLDENPFTIVGIVKDFHANSLHEAIQPLAIFNNTGATQQLSIRYTEGQTTEALAHVEHTYKQFTRDNPIQFYFLDEAYNRMYQSELLIGTLANFFAFIALLISTLGLLGLIGFMADQRTKEIGIRKVLGASIISIVGLLSKELLKLVTIAFLIAIPITYYFAQDWLQGFEYSVSIQWWMFVMAGAGMLLVALATLSFQGVRAATVNPIQSLKND